MKIYDPADYIRYLHVPGEKAAHVAASDSTRACTRLPAGYPNASSRTRLRETRVLAQVWSAQGAVEELQPRPDPGTIAGEAARRMGAGTGKPAGAVKESTAA
jgi:hypothetical protein